MTQGKLAMGFRTGIDAWDEDYPALMLLNAVYGGTTTSKLFLNVREKLSLCYYASSGLMKYKDVMLVSSGVEFSKGGPGAGRDPCPASGLQGRRLYGRRAGVGPPLGGEHPDDHPGTPRAVWRITGWVRRPPASPRRPTSWPSGWSAPPGRRYRRRPRS